MRTYKMMMRESAPKPNMLSRPIANRRKEYRRRLPWIPNVLNFSENIEISEISNKLKTSTKNINTNGYEQKYSKIGILSIGALISEVKKMALAGVGNPMNVSDCLASMLNLANRKAEKTAIIKGKYSTTRSRWDPTPVAAIAAGIVMG